MTAFPNGIGAGVETRRSYLAEDFRTGSRRSVTRWLTTLVGRDDVVRIWLKPVGSKAVVWEHTGVLEHVPELDDLFAAAGEDELQPVAA